MIPRTRSGPPGRESEDSYVTSAAEPESAGVESGRSGPGVAERSAHPGAEEPRKSDGAASGSAESGSDQHSGAEPDSGGPEPTMAVPGPGPETAGAEPERIVEDLAAMGLTEAQEIGRGGFGVVYRCVQ